MIVNANNNANFRIKNNLKIRKQMSKNHRIIIKTSLIFRYSRIKNTSNFTIKSNRNLRIKIIYIL